jgi:hypothetical protein
MAPKESFGFGISPVLAAVSRPEGVSTPLKQGCPTKVATIFGATFLKAYETCEAFRLGGDKLVSKGVLNVWCYRRTPLF